METKRAGGPMSREDFLAKVEFEGGIEDAIEYGLRPEDLDAPATDPLRVAWSALVELWQRGKWAREVVEQALEDGEEE